MAAASGGVVSAVPYEYPKINPNQGFFKNFSACLQQSGQAIVTVVVLVAAIVGLFTLDVALPTQAERDMAAKKTAAAEQTAPDAASDVASGEAPAGETADGVAEGETAPAESAATVTASAAALPITAVTATDTLQESGFSYDAYNYFNAKDWYTAIKGGSFAQNTGEVPVNRTEAANIQLIASWQSNRGLR